MIPTSEATAHRDVDRRTKAIVGVGIGLSNVVGAGVVLALAGWVLPLRSLVSDQQRVLSGNLGLFAVYLVLALLVGVLWGRVWVRVPEAPRGGADPAVWRCHRRHVRQVVVGAPIRLAVVQAVPWVAAVVVFGALNARYSWALAAVVAGVVTLGGLATVAVAYRLSDLALRREVARVLAVDPPSGLRVPGVRARSLGAWVLGTGVPLSGVVLVAATAVLLPGYFSVTRLGVAVGVLALVALAVGFLLTALTSTSIAGPVVEVARALGRIERGDLAVRVAVSDTTELGVLQAGFNTMVDGLRERDRVRALFGRHVGEDVAQAALDSEVELGGEVREVAVLFVDLVGSTRMALEKPPHDVVSFLNGFFSQVVDVVEDHGGWIDKFEGDAALAVFGAPSAVTDAAGSALAAARRLAARLEGAEHGVEVGIGVSAGPAVAGYIGDHRRYEYTVIGDPVNEASRLCDLAKTRPGRVAASDQVIARAAASETQVWTVAERRRLRGRDAATVVSVPRSGGRRVHDHQGGRVLPGPRQGPGRPDDHGGSARGTAGETRPSTTAAASAVRTMPR